QGHRRWEVYTVAQSLWTGRRETPGSAANQVGRRLGRQGSGERRGLGSGGQQDPRLSSEVVAAMTCGLSKPELVSVGELSLTIAMAIVPSSCEGKRRRPYSSGGCRRRRRVGFGGSELGVPAR